MEPFELDGIWWLPDRPEARIGGTLRYDPKEGALLTLIGTFKTDLRGLSSKDISDPTIILGISVNGKPITLYMSYEKSFNLHFPGLPRSVFFSNFVFIGCHFSDEEEILLEEVSLTLSNLDEWISISGFEQTFEPDQNDKINKVTYTYQPPKEISASVDNYNIKLSFGFDCHSERAISFNLSQTVFINIKPLSALSFNNYRDGIMKHVRDFISLAIGRATHFNSIVGRSKSSITKLLSGEIVFNEIDIYTRSANIAGDSTKKIDLTDMLFTYQDIADNLGLYLKNWIDKSVSLRPIYGQYLGTFYNPSTSGRRIS